jgi:hypothetical protein
LIEHQNALRAWLVQQALSAMMSVQHSRQAVPGTHRAPHIGHPFDEPTNVGDNMGEFNIQMSYKSKRMVFSAIVQVVLPMAKFFQPQLTEQ